MSLQMTMWAPKSEWVPPAELPDRAQRGPAAVHRRRRGLCLQECALAGAGEPARVPVLGGGLDLTPPQSLVPRRGQRPPGRDGGDRPLRLRRHRRALRHRLLLGRHLLRRQPALLDDLDARTRAGHQPRDHAQRQQVPEGRARKKESRGRRVDILYYMI